MNWDGRGKVVEVVGDVSPSCMSCMKFFVFQFFKSVVTQFNLGNFNVKLDTFLKWLKF